MLRFISVLAILIMAVGTDAPAATLTQDGKTVDVPVCGGKIPIRCKDDEWCDYPSGAICGANDHFGTCRPKPASCPIVKGPKVCGCDGKTYDSQCDAQKAGVDISSLHHCGLVDPS
jgi:hypothetical protein